jgi:hypothetical protein
VIGTRDRPALEYLTGLCTNSPYYCIRPLIGDLKAQGSLFVFDSWEGPDFYCSQPCPPPKRNGGLWRVDGSTAVEIASSGGALTPLAVDAGRILVDHEDGTLELMSSGGSSLQTFHVDTGDFLGARAQGRDVVVLKHDTIADYDADSGALLHEWPLPPGDRQFEGLRDGVAVLVSGREFTCSASRTATTLQSSFPVRDGCSPSSTSRVSSTPTRSTIRPTRAASPSFPSTNCRSTEDLHGRAFANHA